LVTMKITRADLWKADLYSWMVDNYYLPSQEKYLFKGYEYLIDIAKKRWSPGDELFIEKSAQCGVSEFAIAVSMWMAERGLKNMKGMGYVFPAMKQLYSHIKTRVFPILEIPRFTAKTTNSSLDLIMYNGVPWNFRSGNTRSLKSWPADFIVADEFDEFEDPITIIPTLEARMNASHYRNLLGLSTPTAPDVGIDKAMSLCSQNNWYIKCDACHKEFSPLQEIRHGGFDNCVVWDKKGGAAFVCPHCRDLTQTNGRPGHWVQDNTTNNQKTSYSISRIFLANATLEELLTKYEDALNIQEFYNSDLGLPYSPPNSKLTRKIINEVCVGDAESAIAYGKGVTWAGIDVGKICYYKIGVPWENGVKKVIAYGSCRFEEVPNLLKRFNVKYLVIDLRPYESEVKKIVREKRGYYACDFNSGHQTDWYSIVKADVDTLTKTVRIVKADRTQSCDNLIEQIAVKQQIIYPASAKNDNDFVHQMCSPMRLDKSDKETGEIKSFYKSSSKKDHFFFAGVYLNLAFNLKKSAHVRAIKAPR